MHKTPNRIRAEALRSYYGTIILAYRTMDQSDTTWIVIYRDHTPAERKRIYWRAHRHWSRLNNYVTKCIHAAVSQIPLPISKHRWQDYANALRES